MVVRVLCEQRSHVAVWLLECCVSRSCVAVWLLESCVSRGHRWLCGC